MQLTDLNPGHDIGANSLLIELGPFRLLLDCGLHPKKAGLTALPNLRLLDGVDLDFVIITHSHLDHGGSLPVVLRGQQEATVLVTPGTQVLLPRMLRNSCSVMTRQRDELGLPEYPLFTYSEIERLERRLLALPVNKPKVFDKDGESLEITLFHGGHLAGAAGVRLVYKKRRHFFTGDVLFADQLTLAGARFPEETFDTMVTETTRGATVRPATSSREKEGERLMEVINQTLGNGGTVLVPVFALGRMQEVLAMLHKARLARKLPEVPIFCSGLGLDLVDYLDTLSRDDSSVRFRRRIMHDLGVQPLRQKMVAGREPGQRSLYIVSSGMMVENTPSYAVAASLLSRPHHALCFVGYCDPDTPGGRLLTTKREQEFTFDNLEYTTPVRAAVHKFDLSAHADREELLTYAQARKPKKVILTHGDPPARVWFAGALAGGKHAPQVIDPVPGDKFEV